MREFTLIVRSSNRRALAVFLAMILLVTSATSADAFDGTRRGFLLGFNLGPVFDETISAQWELKIGGGISDQWIIFYKGTALGHHSGSFIPIRLSAMPTIATTYYFRPKASSFFATGGLSYWIVDGGFSGYPDWTVEGPGFYLGAGFEAWRTLNLELNYLQGYFPSEGRGGNTFSFLIGVALY